MLLPTKRFRSVLLAVRTVSTRASIRCHRHTDKPSACTAAIKDSESGRALAIAKSSCQKKRSDLVLDVHPDHVEVCPPFRYLDEQCVVSCFLLPSKPKVNTDSFQVLFVPLQARCSRLSLATSRCSLRQASRPTRK